MRYEQSEELARIAEAVISVEPELQFLTSPDCRIAYLICSRAKRSRGKVVYAAAEKVKDKYKAFIESDFIITFYADALALDEDHQKRVMYHELLHISFDGEKYSIVPHNVEDFRQCIDRWGVDWASDQGEQMTIGKAGR